MLYKKNKSEVLNDELFQNPTSEYRGTPFWAWNCKVSKADIDHTLEYLKEMGMGGSHVHCRTGMDIPYLSDEFMETVRYAHEKGKKLDMLTWLYDEDRFPSGAAGGLVTKNWEYRQRYLLFSPEPLEETKRRKFLTKYAVALEQGCIKEYHRLEKEENVTEDFYIWYLYREIAGDNPWFNNQAYLDTLNPKAVDKFLEVTHEAYAREFGTEFGKTIPAIFTDEPQFSGKIMLNFAEEKKQVLLPYTDDFCETYQEAYGDDFLQTFPECIWELPNGKLSSVRYRYYDHITERFASAFADRIGDWCKRHEIALTGHLMSEPTLLSQTGSIGEAMRSYRSFDIPGIDMLYDSRELNTAKQTQSAVHQYGCEGMLSELYGVTGWEFDFRGHKLAGDWQAALGVNIRVHHLTWTSMAGEAKRDYPAAIGYQSPWYKEYSLIEDYFSRINTVLTRGKAEVKVGVIHPVESYWLYWGTKEQTETVREEMDIRFKELTEWLLYGLIDFDFISESLWKEQTPEEWLEDQEALFVGKMKYETIVVPACVTLRSSTLKRLKAFQREGGRVIFAGEVPKLVDAVPSEEILQFSEDCERVTFSRNQILEALEEQRLIEVQNQNGVRVKNMLYQMREDGERKWLFLAHCNPMPNPDLPKKEELLIKIKGIYRPVLYDAMHGEIREIPYAHDNGFTIMKEVVYDHDSLLYALLQTNEIHTEIEHIVQERNVCSVKLPDFAEVSLEEPNVLLLDLAEWKLDDGPWEEREEILRIDNELRRRVRYQLRMEAFPQPWVMEEKEKIAHHVSLRFKIRSEINLDNPVLALENAAETKVFLNGEEMFSERKGYYVDHSIQTVQLSSIRKGENTLILEMPYYHKFNLENMFLLGDFGVQVAGSHTVLTKSMKKLAFGDICSQGLPFYGGNLTYEFPITVEHAGDISITVSQFRCPLIKVQLDGTDCGRIAFSPYELLIKDVAAGAHTVKLTAFGNRHNTFGALHNCNHTFAWKGHPDSFRTEGVEWAYEYQLHPQGILISPVIKLLPVL